MEPTREQFYRRRIAELEMEVDSWKIRAVKAEAEVTDLKAQVARLAEQVAKLLKNSSNSSKPPSGDIVKPPKPPAPRGATKRKIGGRPGRRERQGGRDSAVRAISPNHRDPTLCIRKGWATPPRCLIVGIAIVTSHARVAKVRNRKAVRCV